MQPRYLFIPPNPASAFVIDDEPTRDDSMAREVGVIIVRLADRHIYEAGEWVPAPSDLAMPPIDTLADGMLTTPEDSDHGAYHVHPAELRSTSAN